MKRFDYLDYLGAEIYLYENDVREICYSGPNDAEVAEVSAKNYVIEQFAKFSDDELFDAVKKLVLYDAVSPEEYPHNRQESIQWLVWHLAWNIFDAMAERIIRPSLTRWAGAMFNQIKIRYYENLLSQNSRWCRVSFNNLCRVREWAPRGYYGRSFRKD